MTNIKTNINGNILTIFLCGRIDSSCATNVETDVMKAISSSACAKIILDAENLEYVSSAGLRIILKVKKTIKDTVLINANSEVFDVLEMSGFTQIIHVEKAFRKLSVEGCKVVGRGAKGTLYKLNQDTAVKVYKDADCLEEINKERELARAAFVLGIPTAISYDVVKVDDKYGSVFELLNASSYSDLIANNPDKFDKYVEEFATLLKTIHSTEVKSDIIPDIRPKITNWLKSASPYISEKTCKKIIKMIEDIPDTHTMIHGDYHTNNLMMQGDETIVIDMDTLSYGHPIFELANIRITYKNFSEYNKTMTEDFYGFSCQVAAEIWNKFLPIYLGTNNKDKIEEVDTKVNILSYLRMLQHFAKRNSDTNLYLDIIKYCSERLDVLVEKIECLTF